MRDRSKVSLVCTTVAGAVIVSAFAHQSKAAFPVAANTCGDFAAVWNKKPKQLAFAGCQLEPSEPDAVPKARYRLEGNDAIVIEQFLQREFGMAPLRFICCGWEPVVAKGDARLLKLGSYRDDRGITYQIAMYSGETPIATRQQWSAIDTFRVEIVQQTQP
ncbi:MAG: DUF4952 domain-containing protein [Oscillatoriales cyanobacterium]|nr:MAG: DUF4952 domain-containing protein [Oscillatoriales cyanobacterium]